MAGRAFILGGTGQIGRAAARSLLDAGWDVTVASRAGTPLEGARGAALDRAEPSTLAAALGEGADLVVDTVAYDEAHADQLLACQDSVGAFVVISSVSVYRDAAGRTLDEARTGGFPDMPERMTEAQPTVAPGPATYSTRKVALERRLLDAARVPVTILRPGAIHGPHSRHPREWFFVKRLLDGRRRIPVAYRAESRFHTIAVTNIAELIRVVADRPGTRVLNAVDPEPPTVGEIARAVMAALGREAEVVGLDDGAYPPRAGVTPWSVPRPFTFSDAAARDLSYAPAAAYTEAVRPACEWLAATAESGKDWRSRFPVLAAYPFDLFDYAAEDALLADPRA